MCEIRVVSFNFSYIAQPYFKYYLVAMYTVTIYSTTSSLFTLLHYTVHWEVMVMRW